MPISYLRDETAQGEHGEFSGYWAAARGPTHSSYTTWQNYNDDAQGIANVVKVFYPSLYAVFLEDYATWTPFANNTLTEAARMRDNTPAGDQPIFAYIMMQYHYPNGAENLQYISGPFFRHMLDTCYNHPDCDGIVIWGPVREQAPAIDYNGDGKVDELDQQLYQSWNYAIQQGWWSELQDFMQTVLANQ